MLKIKCERCKRKFFVDVDENGIPKRTICDRCRANALKRKGMRLETFLTFWKRDKDA